ncbi:hypothetical protein VTN00DRAFT_4984 [Thermoascus crustaceus]|uniref:uncharacterized protein n=1 Tax=Thermoascus crustaceus TaxID=5088 RepID=UPI003742AD8E
MQEASEKPKKAPRKHVTTACVPCRESKIRCDGATPNCHNCQKKRKECKYHHGDDKRKVSLRAATELFSARIDQLYQFIYDHGLEPPPMKPEDEAGMNRVLDTLQIPRRQLRKNPSAVNSGGISSQSLTHAFPSTVKASDHALAGQLNQTSERNLAPSSHGQVPSKSSLSSVTEIRDSRSAGGMTSGFNTHYNSSDWDFTLPTAESLDTIYANIDRASSLSADSGSVVSPEGMSLGQEMAQPPGARLEQAQDDSEYETDSGDEAEKEVIEQLSSRMGTLKLAGDGHLRYYGPTSNLNLIDVSASEQRPRPDARSVRQDGQDILNHLRVGQAVDPALEDHLIELYFTWQNPSSYVVDREMFMTARAKWRNELDDTPFYSEVLANAMCALGSAFEARYHPNFVTFPKSLAEFFADRAKALLEIELDSPCVATVQALVILSNHEAASNRDARGWLYSGMSMRLAFDLGLQVDMTPYVEKGQLSATEADVRRVAFWGSYAADHFWGFYLGRPFRMNAGDISVPKPASDLQRAKEEIWYPYGMGDSRPGAQNMGLKNPSELISRQFALLWEMISPLGHILYGCSDIAKHDLQRLNFKVTEDLFAWKANLPSNLQVDLDNDTVPVLPHLLMLHMQYHQIIIFVHRPWVSKSYIQPHNPRQGPGYLHARRMCIESAASVAKLLRLYEKHYTFRRINNQVVAIIFTAALMLIFVTISTSSQAAPGRTSGENQNAEMVAHLNVCFRALDELGQSFENAKRTRDFLVSLQRRWQTRMRKSGTAAPKRLMSGSHPSKSQADSGSGPDSSSRKKSRLGSSSNRQDASIPVSSTIPVSTAPPTTTATLDQQAKHQPHQHHPRPENGGAPVSGPGPGPGDLNWIHNNELRFLSENLVGMGAGGAGLYQPTTPGAGVGASYADSSTMLPSLSDIDAWWDSPPNATTTTTTTFGRSSFEGS